MQAKSPQPAREGEADRPRRTRSRLATRARRELVVALAVLLFGIIGMPLLIWVAGNRYLGGYTHGTNPHAGPLDLLGDFLVALGNGSGVYWGVALGPITLLVLLRLGYRALRARRAGRRA